METKLCDMMDSDLAELQIEMQKYLERIEDEISRRKRNEKQDSWNKVVEAIDDYLYKYGKICVCKDDGDFYIIGSDLALNEIGTFYIN